MSAPDSIFGLRQNQKTKPYIASIVQYLHQTQSDPKLKFPSGHDFKQIYVKKWS